MESLSKNELVSLIQSVFPLQAEDRRLAILIDFPRNNEDDHDNWRKRRALAMSWTRAFEAAKAAIPLEKISLFAYPDVGSNNADLPETMYEIKDKLPEDVNELLSSGSAIEQSRLFLENQLFMALTELSATAPLKIAAKPDKFRAATMPGFSEKMIPALRINYEEVNKRVYFLKEKLDRAQSAQVLFKVDGEAIHEMFFDLRFRKAHASGGRFPQAGTAGNLPSGETYIVPYEGEGEESSLTEGILPVQINDHVVFFKVRENRAYYVYGEGSEDEREHLICEPAYGNMAELGFGVLEAFGIEPSGEILLDEKLGFHIAFGRSEHFGGIVGPEAFTEPAKVIHLDRIYIPATQPRVLVKRLILSYSGQADEVIISDGGYTIF